MRTDLLLFHTSQAALSTRPQPQADTGAPGAGGVPVAGETSGGPGLAAGEGGLARAHAVGCLLPRCGDRGIQRGAPPSRVLPATGAEGQDRALGVDRGGAGPGREPRAVVPGVARQPGQVS